MRRRDFDTKDLRSKSWDEFARPDAPQLDFVFTVCDNAANEVCPVWPGQPMTAHWGIPDPAAVEGNEAQKHLAFADTLRMLTNRIGIFVNLPLASIDRLSLRRKLHEIGATKDMPHERGATVMSATSDVVANDAAVSPMGTFERYLTVWVFLCIVTGIALGHWLPAPFEFLGQLEIAKVNLPVAVLIWLMIIPMLLKIDFSALAQVARTLARHRRNVVCELGGQTVLDGASRVDIHSQCISLLGCHPTRSIPISPV